MFVVVSSLCSICVWFMGFPQPPKGGYRTAITMFVWELLGGEFMHLYVEVHVDVYTHISVHVYMHLHLLMYLYMYMCIINVYAYM